MSLDNKTVVAVTGLPGSGKSTFLRVAKELGYHLIVMGDFVREEAARRNLPPTAVNMGELMFQMRKERGEDFIAQLTVEKAEKMKTDFIVIDGVRNPEEVEKFKKTFKNFYLIAIDSTAELRFKRIRRRFRSDDSTDRDKFEEREARELKVGVGRAMALANLIIDNNSSLGEFKAKVKNVLEEIMRGFSHADKC